MGKMIPVGSGEKLRQLALAVDASRQQLDDDRAARDAFLVQLDGMGVTLEYLARWSGLTDSQVHRILCREAARRR